MSGWTDEQIDLLKSLKSEGRSAGVMASLREFCGKSRNAILGKMFRLGLLNKGEKRTKGYRVERPMQKTTIRLKQANGEKSFVQVADPSEPVSKMLTIVELTASTCRWPSKEKPFTFCGHARHDLSRSYCEYHDKKSRRSEAVR